MLGVDFIGATCLVASFTVFVSSFSSSILRSWTHQRTKYQAELKDKNNNIIIIYYCIMYTYSCREK